MPVPVGAMSDVWLPTPGHPGSFYNATEHKRLVALGLVPEFATDGGPPDPSGQRPSEARQEAGSHTEGGTTMAVAEKPRRKAKKSGLAGLSKAKLRAKLLATPTIADGAWNEAYGAPEREKGETREAYIKRVLS